MLKLLLIRVRNTIKTNLAVIVLSMIYKLLSSKEHENWIFIKLECWHRWTIMVSIRNRWSLISPRAFLPTVAHFVHLDRLVVDAVIFALIFYQIIWIRVGLVKKQLFLKIENNFWNISKQLANGIILNREPNWINFVILTVEVWIRDFS